MTTARTRCCRLASHSSDNNDRSEEEKGPLHLSYRKLQRILTDRKVLCDAFRTMLFAGRESVAVQLSRTFFSFEFSRRSDVWQRLHQEVTQKL